MANFDNERLIMEIHMKPSIWDISSKEYKERDRKIQDWLAVAVTLNDNWDIISETEKDDFDAKQAVTFYLLHSLFVPTSKKSLWMIKERKILLNFRSKIHKILFWYFVIL
ncbi:uncharacterized protein LOC111036647 [Myzus persicae]|uniref:uncharacterized protein LOC111036647 n=1 Tax=Myzus persicae TaxID=13164 RepID=UPI000B931DEB|nr:uncharacterized protein LOC111036647 [Myzus persicae]